MYKVFLADDEIWVIMGLKKLIEKADMPFQVIGEATNGVVALDEIEKKKPDVLFTDIRMPGIDGLALMERLREKRCNRLSELVTGTIEPDEAIASIRQEMEAAGLDQVRQEAQRQLDAYLETRQ